MGKLNTLDISDATGATAVARCSKTTPREPTTKSPASLPRLIQYSLKAGGHLDVSLFGSNTSPADFTVASTLGPTTTLALTGGTDGSNTFNIQSTSAEHADDQHRRWHRSTP